MPLTLATLLTAAVLLAPPPAASQPATPIDEFLTRLEKVGGEVRDFRAGLSYEKYDKLLDESERRFGRVVLEGVGKERRFAFLFEKFFDGSGRAETMRDHWVYAEGWIAEIDHTHKTFTKRQIVEPGKTFDPLKLGEGPFPLPLGQSKAEVLARFEASLSEVPDLPLLQSLKEVQGLHLVPKPGSALAEDTASVDVFYDTATLVPRGVVMLASKGDRTTVLLTEPALNVGLKAEDKALLVIPNPDPTGWAIDIRPWQGPKDESALTQPATPPATPQPATPQPATPQPAITKPAAPPPAAPAKAE